MDFQLLSKAFKHEGTIQDLYTCKGENISPPLIWVNPPEETKSFALIMEDLDSPLFTFTHWVIYNIPATKRELSKAIRNEIILTDGIIQGKNGMQRTGYMGPCPPWGKHRYSFTIYSLNAVLKADPDMNKKKLLKAIENHVLAKANLIGYYSKKSQ